MKMSMRKWLVLRIAVGAGAVVFGFGAKFTVYLAGLRDQGGGWPDIDSITVALFAFVAVGDGIIALGALLATIIPDTPPTGNNLDQMVDDLRKEFRVPAPQSDVDLSPPRNPPGAGNEN